MTPDQITITVCAAFFTGLLMGFIMGRSSK
jgi:hypothetical protein